MPLTQKRGVLIDGYTVSHHAIIPLAIRLSCSAVASRSHCQASSGGCSKLRRSIGSSFGHDRPSDARHLVGNRTGDELGRLPGQQPYDPGMLLRMPPGVLNNGCCTDHEQPSKIAISLLGNAAEPGHGLEAAAHIVGTMMGMNGPIQSPDLQFQGSKLIDNGLQRLFHRGRKSFAITLVRDDLGKLRETFASRLRNEAELGKMGSKRIDQLSALTD